LWSKVLKGKELVEIRLPLGTGIAGTVARSGETINLKDAWKDKRFFSGFDLRSGFQTRTMLCMPMKNRKNKIIGVFQIINKRRGVFNRQDEQFLEAFSDHVALAVESAYLHQAIIEKELVEKEIRIAAEIQQKLLPTVIPAVTGYEMDALAIPCKTIGGDYYDIIPVTFGRYVLVIADVSGKGIPAALLVSTLHASLHAYVEARLPLTELVSRLNRIVYRNTPPERFITMFVAEFNPRTHTLTYVNAGHNPPYVVNAASDDLRQLAAGGLPLGMFEDLPYQSETVTLHPGDHVLMYTDGVTEAMNPAMEEYGDVRFLKNVRRSLGLPLRELRESIHGDVHAFTGAEPQSDDLTFLLLRRLGSSATPSVASA
jgi:sigma-B regulation protein RsbU (phosphoserine phosphatase)